MRPRLRLLLPLAAALLLAVRATPARAQGGWLLQGVLDAELWKTDSASALLARNGGRPGALARVDLWGAVEPLRDVILFGEILGETGSGRDEPGSEIYLDQLGVRYTPSESFTIEAGRVRHPVGLFSTRRLSFRNPMVSAPDGYAGVYPSGVVVSGTLSRVDYRAGMISLPLTREGYVPEAGEQYRPAIGLGVTPVVGVRIGMSASVGSYLNAGIPTAQLAGREWCDWRQRIAAVDVQLSRGYVELDAEAVHASYEVPGGSPIAGASGYVEGKYTVTPRVYVATRVERNDYPYIAERDGGGWIAVRSAFSDAEVAGGYRPAAATLLKLAVRREYRTPSPNPGAPQANGYAVALQLSQQFDVADLARSLRRP